MANFIDNLKEKFKALSPTKVGEYIQESQIYRSIFRVGVPDSDRKRMLVMLGSVFLHLHPVKVRKSGIRMRYTWCMGGITFFLFLVLTFTGLLLMFYYRPTLEYAYADIVDLRQQVPLGIMREIHRWGAHAMVIAVWLHMYRVFMTGSYKPPREFNWNVGVILLVLTLLLSFTGYLLPWDQLAMWAITVGSNMARATPFLGNEGPGAAMLSLGERISTELGRKGLEQVYIKGNKGAIVLTSIGEEAVLTALARQDAKLGLIFLEMRRAAEDLVKLVG